MPTNTGGSIPPFVTIIINNLKIKIMQNQTLVKEKTSQWRQPVSLKAEDMKNRIQNTIDEIEKFAHQNNLIMITHGGAETQSIQGLKQFNSESLSLLSRRSKKRIVKQIYRLTNKPTLVKINRFISFISKLIPGLEVFKVIPSKREQSIIDLRDKYKKTREEFFKAKTEFKNSKKEFAASGEKYLS